MKISIIGAGFTGLAVAYHLAKRGLISTVYHNGAGASGIATGFLHYYAGLHAKYNWNGKEALKDALELIGDFAQKQDQLRVAITEEQKMDYRLCADKYDDVEWIDRIEIPGVLPHPGILIKNAYAVDCKQYLQTLWKTCEQLGVQFERKEVTTLKPFQDQIVIVAMGADTTKLPELAHLPLCRIKGHILRLSWQGPPLPYPINSQAYIMMDKDNQSCWVGSSFERNFLTEDPDINIAKAEIMPKVIPMIPSLADAQVLECVVGFRSSGPAHLPYMKQISERLFVLTGMGSKGLLYHSYFAKSLAEKISPHTLIAPSQRN